MKERRRYPRHPASWPVCLWLSDICFLAGSTVGVSPHGMRIKVLDSRLSALVKPGTRVRVQVNLDGMGGEFTCVGEVRHVTNGAIGLEIGEGLPLTVMAPRAIAPKDYSNRRGQNA